MNEFTTIAAVDLGSNSFRLQLARVIDGQIYPLDSLKETVRLGAGLTSDKRLDAPSQERALLALRRFGERLRGLPPGAVRAVGTNTLRVAKNGPAFLEKAEAALGVPIEVIAGREEARLIFLGVVHSLPPFAGRRLVVDIGGGSTEFIIGHRGKPQTMESLYMGCVSYTLRYFTENRITKSALRAADLATRQELQTIVGECAAPHWQQAVGSSGTARSLADVLQAHGWSNGDITREGLEKLRAVLLKAGRIDELSLPGLRADRAPVLPGGFAIMYAVFDELGIDHMVVANSALREGVLYDLIGRFHHHDMRETTVAQFVRRYHIDTAQARRVERLAENLFEQVVRDLPGDHENALTLLRWAATLHETGLSIAHSGYHKHSAYILQHADMPGFSKADQLALSLLVLGHRGRLAKMQGLVSGLIHWCRIFALRMSALVHRTRRELEVPPIQARWEGAGFVLEIDREWLRHNPLTEHALRADLREWRDLGFHFLLNPGLSQHDLAEADATAS